MDKIICPVTLTGDHISPERIMCGYAGNYGIYRLQFSPGEGWEGLDVRVTWETAGEPVVTWPDAEGFVDVPPEATAAATRGCRVATVVGLADGVKRVSASLMYTVRHGGAVEGKDPAVPTPDVAEMLLKEMGAKLDVPTDDGQTGDVPVRQEDGSTKWGKTGLDVSGAKVGQTVEITAVDAEGKPTAWKAAEYMAKSNPTGTGAFSMGRKAGSTVGECSHAEGYRTTASGDYSHAEGNYTTALGIQSHAEGSDTKANRQASHAEGFSTIASSDSQHVQGKYNIEDADGKYAHIVGNGTSNSARSNAHTLDWSGNAWYAGTVEGTAVIVKSSTEGSTKRFKITVDDSGTISATEV